MNLREIEELQLKAVRDFAEFLQDYAASCAYSGYDGIGVEDIAEKLEEWENL